MKKLIVKRSQLPNTFIFEWEIQDIEHDNTSFISTNISMPDIRDNCVERIEEQIPLIYGVLDTDIEWIK